MLHVADTEGPECSSPCLVATEQPLLVMEPEMSPQSADPQTSWASGLVSDEHELTAWPAVLPVVRGGSLIANTTGRSAGSVSLCHPSEGDNVSRDGLDQLLPFQPTVGSLHFETHNEEPAQPTVGDTLEAHDEGPALNLPPNCCPSVAGCSIVRPNLV